MSYTVYTTEIDGYVVNYTTQDIVLSEQEEKHVLQDIALKMRRHPNPPTLSGIFYNASANASIDWRVVSKVENNEWKDLCHDMCLWLEMYACTRDMEKDHAVLSLIERYEKLEKQK